LIDVYGAQLAVIGAKVVAARVRYLRSLHALFTDAFAEVASQSETAAMRYHALWHPQPLDVDDLDRLTSELERAIQQSRAKDFARGATTCGPHHDDVEFELNAHPARQYASQGQTRSLVLAFRIAQILHVYQRSGSYPLLLLDDVSSELDPTRNRHLFERLAAIPCQLLVTTTRADLIPLAADGGARFVIHAGQLSQT